VEFATRPNALMCTGLGDSDSQINYAGEGNSVVLQLLVANSGWTITPCANDQIRVAGES
jgi:hypothetical protein